MGRGCVAGASVKSRVRGWEQELRVFKGERERSEILPFPVDRSYVLDQRTEGGREDLVLMPRLVCA